MSGDCFRFECLGSDTEHDADTAAWQIYEYAVKLTYTVIIYITTDQTPSFRPFFRMMAALQRSAD